MIQDVFAALADPTRRAILEQLRSGERAVGELVEVVDASQPTVSKHLRVLREIGLVSQRAAGQRRFYRIEAQPLREAAEVLVGFARGGDTAPESAAVEPAAVEPAAVEPAAVEPAPEPAPVQAAGPVVAAEPAPVPEPAAAPEPDAAVEPDAAAAPSTAPESGAAVETVSETVPEPVPSAVPAPVLTPVPVEPRIDVEHLDVEPAAVEPVAAEPVAVEPEAVEPADLGPADLGTLNAEPAEAQRLDPLAVRDAPTSGPRHAHPLTVGGLVSSMLRRRRRR